MDGERRVRGADLGGGRSEVMIERVAGGVRITVAAPSRFALVLDRDGAEVLRSSLRAGTACAVPGRHETFGRRLLSAVPHDAPDWTQRPPDQAPYRGPMVLSLALPDGEAHVVVEPENLPALIDALTEGVDRPT